MISRVADHCFWFGRYLERAESAARVLPATHHLALDGELSPLQCWLPVIIVAGEEPAFLRRYGESAAEDGEIVQRYMTWETDNLTSIRASLGAVRENARSIREVLSIDAWEAINAMHLWIGTADADRVWERDRDGFYRRIRESSLLTLGVIRSTMLHDEALDFIWLGVVLERVSQTARILDVHYHTVTTRPSYFGVVEQEPHGPHSVVETAVWLALLRACSGLEPFMQCQQGRVTGKAVAKFLLQEPRHPRSIRFCVHEASERFAHLRPPEDRGADRRGDSELPGAKSQARLRALDEWVATLGDDALDPGEMHHVLTHCIDEVSAICATIGNELLGYPNAHEQ
jgi:uncharacterized alpha-E superfamily protein